MRFDPQRRGGPEELANHPGLGGIKRFTLLEWVLPFAHRNLIRERDQLKRGLTAVTDENKELKSPLELAKEEIRVLKERLQLAEDLDTDGQPSHCPPSPPEYILRFSHPVQPVPCLRHSSP